VLAPVVSSKEVPDWRESRLARRSDADPEADMMEARIDTINGMRKLIDNHVQKSDVARGRTRGRSGAHVSRLANEYMLAAIENGWTSGCGLALSSFCSRRPLCALGPHEVGISTPS